MLNKLLAKLAASMIALPMMAGAVVATNGSNWNTDGKNGITRSEFRAGFVSNRAFETWDADNSGALSRAEIEAGVGEKRQAFNSRYGEDWFEEWDENSDSAIDEDEYYDGLYASYDANHSNIIEDAEIGYVGDDMSDGGWFDIE